MPSKSISVEFSFHQAGRMKKNLHAKHQVGCLLAYPAESKLQQKSPSPAASKVLLAAAAALNVTKSPKYHQHRWLNHSTRVQNSASPGWLLNWPTLGGSCDYGGNESQVTNKNFQYQALSASLKTTIWPQVTTSGPLWAKHFHLQGLVGPKALPFIILASFLPLFLLAYLVGPVSAQQPGQLNQMQAQQQPPVGSSGQFVPPILPPAFINGAGIDIVGLNKIRFEHNHHHAGEASDSELRKGAMIESKLASVPSEIMASLPQHLSRELLEALASEDDESDSASSAILKASGAASAPAAMMAAAAAAASAARQDPDGVGIERLTKSCLSIQASSAKPEQLNVTFHLYTKANPNSPFIMHPSISRHELLTMSPFNPSKPIKWITHGFKTNLDKSEWMIDAKDRILTYEDANVFLTDWRKGASPAMAFYPKAAANAHIVAKLIVNVLRRLKEDIDLSEVHLIGHSLGAHIMGFVGSAFTEEHLHQIQPFVQMRAGDPSLDGRLQAFASASSQRQLIGRITACDPALPCFGPASEAPNSHIRPPPIPSQREEALGLVHVKDPVQELLDWTPTLWTHLRPDSAMLVEVMHSNPGIMGYTEPLGDYDFYPNGLERQPGCGSSEGEAQKPNAPQDSLYYNNGRGQPFAVAFDQAAIPGTRMKRQIFSSIVNFLSRQSDGQAAASQNNLAHSNQAATKESSTLDRFIKPIKEFFQGYTCSHHRSVEYMVESMYYDRIPPSRRLEPEFVCQMVGYHCPDYASFKKGFCFQCQNDNDCRTFMMRSIHPAQPTVKPSIPFALTPSPQLNAQITRLRRFSQIFRNSTNQREGLGLAKRVLPTTNHLEAGNYMQREQHRFYFDTKPASEFCLNHYHLLVKYRYFRVRDNVVADGFELMGARGNITRIESVNFNRFSYQAYTMLLTEPKLLGPIESLTLFGDQLKPSQIEYIEVTYMSNLDPEVRALNSAQLCRAQSVNQNGPLTSSVELDYVAKSRFSSLHLFIRCSRTLV